MYTVYLDHYCYVFVLEELDLDPVYFVKMSHVDEVLRYMAMMHPLKYMIPYVIPSFRLKITGYRGFM